MTSGCTGGTGTVVGGAGSGSNGPCGACKYLRRKCVEGCVFAPYFDTEQGSAHFAAVHRVFGASNASKLLLRIPPQRRFDAVVTLCYEALARVRDPVYGCVSHIFSLQQQVVNLQAELANIQARLSTIQRLPAHQLQQPPPPPVSSEPPTSPPQQPSLPIHRPTSITSSLNSTVTPLASSFDPQEALLTAAMDTGDLPESLLDDDGDGCSDLHTLSSELIYKYFSGAKFCSSD